MRRVLPLLFVVALFGAGCTDGGEPDDYDTQTIEVDGETVSLVEYNFVNSCEESNEGARGIDDVSAYCECAYLTVKTQTPFEQFRSWDDAMRDDPENPPPEFAALIGDVELPCTVRDLPPTTTTDPEDG